MSNLVGAGPSTPGGGMASPSDSSSELQQLRRRRASSVQKQLKIDIRDVNFDTNPGKMNSVFGRDTPVKDSPTVKSRQTSGSRRSSNNQQPVVPPSSSQSDPDLNGASSKTDASLPQYNGLWSFVWNELTHGYALQNDPIRYAEKRRKVYAFIQIPRELERFLTYGFAQCLDAFLYYFTLLPLRFLLAIFQLLTSIVHGRGLSASQSCDILKVIMLSTSVALLQLVDTSILYHLVRGQAVIKLYIFYNMLEVADKLFSSFGQDILDALYWTATEPSSQRRYLPYLGTVPHLLLAIAYLCSHTMLILFQATTLNVAFNSHNKALLTIMLSNNFVELKGSVFKKFAKPNLFQMACSDVRERFHYLILLSFVIIRNMSAVNWAMDHLLEMAPDLLMVVLGEFMVDWTKHAFITKFNEIPFEVYRDFTTTLAYDVVKSRRTDAFSDHSDQVARRMGFVPLPLSVLVVRILLQFVKDWEVTDFWVLGMLYVCLLSLKTLISIVVLGKACKYVAAYESMQQHAKSLGRILGGIGKEKQSKSVPSSPRLKLIEFNDVVSQATDSRGFTLTDLFAHMQQTGVEAPNLSAVLHSARDMQHSHCTDDVNNTLAQQQLHHLLTQTQQAQQMDTPPASGCAQSPAAAPSTTNTNTTAATVTNVEAASILKGMLRSASVNDVQATTSAAAVNVSVATDLTPVTDRFSDTDTFSPTKSTREHSEHSMSDVLDETMQPAVDVPTTNNTNNEHNISPVRLTNNTQTQANTNRVKLQSECESLQKIDRYTLQDRIEP